MTANDDIDARLKGLAPFSGALEQVVAELADLKPLLDWARDDPEPSGRTIRYYVSEGALDRPERSGKSAIYRYRHLLQYLAVRWLLKDGWPLAKAGAEAASRPNAALETLILSPHDAQSAAHGPSAPAGAPIASFGLGAGEQPTTDGKPLAREIAARQLALSARLGAMSPTIGPDGVEAPPVGLREALRIDLAPWCSVTIDHDKAATITAEEAQALGDALARALTDARIARHGARTKKRR